MSFLTTSPEARAIMSDAEVADLLVNPFAEQSTAAQVCTIHKVVGDKTLGGVGSMRFPILAADPAVGFVAEGQEIPQGNPETTEIVVNGKKIAGLTVVSNELVQEGTKEGINQIGAGLLRQITRTADLAFFGNPDSPNAPAGLNKTDPSVIEATPSSMDWALEAKATAEENGAPLTSFVAHPRDLLAVTLLKESAGSNRNLLQPDATQTAGSTLAGLPVYTSTQVERGTIWGIPQDVCHLVIVQDAEVISDSSAYFTTDMTAIRAKMRVGYGFTMPKAIIRVNLTTEDAEGND